MLLVVDAGDRLGAHVAGLPEPTVHAVDALVRGAALAQVESAPELLVDRVRELLDLIRIELPRERERREPCVVKDFVRPGAADPGQGALVAQERVEAPRVGCEDAGEPFAFETERLRPEMCELGLSLFRRQEPDAGALLRAGLGEDELRPSLEPQAEGRQLRAILRRSEVAKAAGAHQVHQEHELAVLGREEQALAAAMGAGEASPVELAERGVDRLERGHVRRPRLRDRKGGNGAVERAPPRLHLR